MSSEIRQQAAADELDWRELEDVLAEIASLAKGDTRFEDFAVELLDRAVEMLAAVGGAIWLRDDRGSLRLVGQKNLAAVGGGDEVVHRRRLAEVLDRGDAQVVLPDDPASGPGASRNPTGYLLLIHPLKLDRDVVGLMEIVQRPEADAAVVRGNRRFLGLVCELASDHLVRRELRGHRERQSRAGHFATFVERVHATLDRRACTYELVYEGRRLIGCDRVGVAIRRGRGYRLVAMSGVDTIERRSNAVRRLEHLAAVVAKTGQPFWHAGDDLELPPQIAEPLDRYLDQAHPRTIGLVPLSIDVTAAAASRAPVIAVLVVEQFDAELDDSMRSATNLVAEQGRLALWNALRYESLPTLPWARRRNLMPGTSALGARSVMAAVAIVGLVAAMLFVPADFTVYAEGQLQPQIRHEVFAPMDGQVMELAVEHGESVAAGQKLVELGSPPLDLEIQRVEGEYETARKRLLVVESAMLQSRRAEERTGFRADQLASEQEELIQLLDSQRKQLQLLYRQRQELAVNSPIDGHVLTWELDQQLRGRPVQRGQALMTVADLSGRWVAEIEMPDDRIGHLLEAQAAGAERLTTSFQLATDRSGVYQGTVREVAARTDINDQHMPVVKVVVDFDKTALPSLRPGATIFAWIHCGRRSLGYVWFHELIEAVRGWLFF